VDAYLTKPYEPDELVAVVSNILNRVERTHAEIAKIVGTTSASDEAVVMDEELTDAEARVAHAVLTTKRSLLN